MSEPRLQLEDWVGVISDTHGLMRPEALEALQGAALLVHAGDIGGPEVLTALEQLAPVLAVRGNNDRDPWAAAIPDVRTLGLWDSNAFLVHDLSAGLRQSSRERAFGLVVSGHSHRPRIEREGAVLFLNPGSAGPRRFTLPVTVARVRQGADGLEAELVELAV